MHFIGVGTPQQKDGYAADLTYVNAAVDALLPHLSPGDIVAGKSTVPVGTGDKVVAILREHAPDHDVQVVSNPEFLREGAAIGDFKRPDRIVIGTEDLRAQQVMREVYRPLYLNESPILFTGRRTAELIPGARFELIDGMGHEYPPQLWERWVDLVTEHARSAEAASA